MTRESQNRIAIGRRLAEIRQNRGLSQQDVADLAGLHQKAVARVELGKFSIGIDILAAIAKVLNCEICVKELK